MPVIPAGFLNKLPLNYKVQRAGFEEIGAPDDTVVARSYSRPDRGRPTA